MRVTLIYCRIEAETNFLPPLGILYIAGVLEQAGYTVQVIDPFPGDESIADRVAAFRPDLVGLSVLTTQVQRAAEIVAELRPRVPGALFCAGGAHPTALPERTLHDLGLDFVIVGEGEHTLRDVCARLDRGEPIAGTPGTVCRDGDHAVIGPRRELIADLDALPFPARHLLDFPGYLRPPGPFRGAFVRRATSMMATRGCPYSCIFCGSHNLFGRKTRRRSVGNVVDEIAHLVEAYAVDSIYFIDDTFTLDPAWVSAFCRELSARQPHIRWGCQLRADTLSEPLLREMKQAGCIWLAVGVESGSASVLRSLRKGTDPQMLREAFRLIRRVGFITSASFVVGSPDETMADVDETLALARDIRADFYNFFFLTPFPGSDLYDMALRQGWLDPTMPYLTSWDVRHGEEPVMSITFSRPELARIRARLQNRFFWHDYLSYLKNGPLVREMASAVVRHPGDLWRGVRKFARTRRFDDIAENVLQAYRVDAMSRRAGAENAQHHDTTARRH